MRAFLIVLDSVGIGAAPDAADYGDEGSNTLVHIGKAVGGISLPTLQKLGLGNIPGLIGPDRIPGVPEAAIPLASFGAMEEQSKGKDTTTGHWEMAGLCMEKGFHVFPPDFPSFPAELIRQFEMQTGRKHKMQTMDGALLDLYHRAEISYDVCLSNAREPDFIRSKLGEHKGRSA